MKLIVYIGRFQPFHNGHLKQIVDTIKNFEVENNHVRLVMLLGCNNDGRTLKNPFTFDERKTMIIDSISKELRHKIVIEPIHDIPSDNEWTYNVIQIVNKYKYDYLKDDVYLIGDADEKSSHYLDFFEPWVYIGDRSTGEHASDVRAAYFKRVHQTWEDHTLNSVYLNIAGIKTLVPEGTYNFLNRMIVDKELMQLVERNNV